MALPLGRGGDGAHDLKEAGGGRSRGQSRTAAGRLGPAVKRMSAKGAGRKALALGLAGGGASVLRWLGRRGRGGGGRARCQGREHGEEAEAGAGTGAGAGAGAARPCSSAPVPALCRRGLARSFRRRAERRRGSRAEQDEPRRVPPTTSMDRWVDPTRGL